ncbi:Uncharacterized protein Fot_28453 [Forsythia ovata]|uniref:Uncharacterized protein n=1 Tax=Forsythia ovata TaxID=205694 RepID=A0ABD1TP20_9LAMI
MISVLDQERLLGTTLGSILTGVVIFQQQKSIYESIYQTQSQPHEPILGRRSRQELAHIWNKAVDKTLELLDVELNGGENAVELLGGGNGWCVEETMAAKTLRRQRRWKTVHYDGGERQSGRRRRVKMRKKTVQA